MDIAGGNLFMMCERLNTRALSELPQGYHFRTCRREELDIWKTMHFDTPEIVQANIGWMHQYFTDVYAPREEEYWQRCIFVCDADDTPLGTCFVWRAYNRIDTLQWYKVRKPYEGLGLGRALLGHVLQSQWQGEAPIFLHTHPACCRAIKLYTDFGFALLRSGAVGGRENHLQQALPYLQQNMTPEAYAALHFADAPESLLRAAESSAISEF